MFILYRYPQNTYEATGLQFYTNYTIKIAAFNVKGAGDYSPSIIVITEESSKKHFVKYISSY